MYSSTPNISNITAKAMFDYIQNNYQNIYLGLAKSTEWNITDTKIDVDSSNQMNRLLKEFVALYKINKNNISLGFERKNWEADIIIEEYNPDIINKCYVITDSFNIYKCISNNNSISVNKPNHVTFNIKTYDDGYKWKYLYTLNEREIEVFLTDSIIPIQYYTDSNSIKGITESSAIPGTIDSYKIINGGSGYTNVNIILTGDGTGASATAELSNGAIYNIIIDNAGINYTYVDITITGDGTGGNISPVISPINGHGSNLVNELSISSIILSSYIATKEADKIEIPKKFDYRKIALLSGIKDNNFSVNQNIIPGCYVLSVNDSKGFKVGDKIQLNNVTGTVVYKDLTPSQHLLYINGITSNITAIDIENTNITILDTDVSTKIIKCIYTPNINADFSILHLEHIDVNTRYEYMLDLIKIIINF